MSNLINLDAAESAFFLRQLEHIKAQQYDVKRPEFKARDFIPVDSSAGDGVSKITWRSKDQVGSAKLITDYADDLPRVDLFGVEESQKVYDIGDSFGYSIREIRAAARANVDLSAEKANVARRAMEQKLDEIAALGHTGAQLNGFLNSSAPAIDAATGNWSGLTADQILADMNASVNNMRSATNGVESPTTMLLPESQYTLISQLRVPDLNMTVLQFFLSTNPFITEIMPWYKLAGAGAGAVDRAVVYKRDPEVLTLEIPSEFEMFDPQARNLEFVVPCRMVTAGTVIRYPAAVRYIDGI